MKVLLTGSTGFIGGEVLRRTLAHPSVTEAIVLARRQVTDPAVVNNPKLKTIIHTDFEKYDGATKQQIEGAEACIWSLGEAADLNMERQIKTRMDWPKASAEIFAKGAPKGKKFRFVLTSGQITERDQDKNLWVLGKVRKMAGRMEIAMVDMTKEHENLEMYVVRPGAVTAVKKTFANRLMMAVSKHVGVDELATAMVDIAVNGNNNGPYFDNDDLKTTGRKILDAEKK